MAISKLFQFLNFAFVTANSASPYAACPTKDCFSLSWYFPTKLSLVKLALMRCRVYIEEPRGSKSIPDSILRQATNGPPAIRH